MNELIKIEKNDTLTQAVNARDLHTALQIKARFGNWVQDQIIRADLLQGVDFTVNNVKVIDDSGFGGVRCVKEYFLTIDASKNIAMLSQTAKGKEVRAYFIECERRAISDKPESKPLSMADHLRLTADLLERQEAIQAKQIEQDKRLFEVEAMQSAIVEGFKFYTVLGYANIHSLQHLILKDAQQIGKKCAQLSCDRGIPIDKVRDTRFGLVNAYQEAILNEVVAEYMQ